MLAVGVGISPSFGSVGSGSAPAIMDAPVLTQTSAAGTNPPEWDSDFTSYQSWDGVNTGDKQLMRWRRVNGGAWTTEAEQGLDDELIMGGFTWPLLEAAKTAGYLAGGYFEATEQRVRYVAGVEVARSTWAVPSVVDTIVAPPSSFADFFGGGDIGVAWDPTDLSTVFSDIAGSTAGAFANPVGQIRDVSGKNNHLTADATGSRPQLVNTNNGIMTFDGVDDCLKSLTGGGQYAAGAQTFIALINGANGTGCIAAESNSSLTPPVYAPGTRGQGASGNLLNYQRNNANSAISDTIAVNALNSTAKILIAIDDGAHVKVSIGGAAFVNSNVNPYTRNAPLTGGVFSVGAARRAGTVFGPFAGSIGAGMVIGRVLAGTLGTAGDEITKAYNLVATKHGLATL